MFFRKRPKQNKLNEAAQLFIDQSLNGAADLQAINNATWHMDQIEQWSADTAEGTITFTFTDKIVTANVQIVGSLYNGEFMWGWDHPSAPKPVAKAAMLAKQWGEDNFVERYTRNLVSATEEDAWEFAAVTARLSEASGIYRGKAGSNWIYMTFSDITMKKRQ